MGTKKYEVERFTGFSDFGLWQLKMRALLVQQGLVDALKGDTGFPQNMNELQKKEIMEKAHSAVILSSGDEVLCQVSQESTTAGIWTKLETLYMTKSLVNRLYLKQALYSFKMNEEKPVHEQLGVFNKLVLNLENIDVMIDDEDQALMLLSALPKSYSNFKETLCFDKLESLTCMLSANSNWHHFAHRFTFPTSLQKLHVANFHLHWDDLTAIASLPRLIKLELHSSAFGSEWNPVELGFPCLRFLLIYGCPSLVCWNADSSHFPVLEYLYLAHVDELDEIPSGIGDIPTLQEIALYDCHDPVAISAARILVEQQELGNDDLRVEVRFSFEEKLISFSEMIQEEGLTCNNLRLKLSSS